MADPAPATGTSVSDVAARIEGLLAGEESPDNQGPATEPQDGQAEGDEPLAENADPQDPETTPTDEEGEPEAEEGDAEPQETAPKVAAEDAIVTVKVDGKDEQVTVKELSQGYLRQRDYTQKTQTLANERKAFEPERQAVFQERQKYAQMLPLVAHFLQAQLPAEPNPQLMDQDPIEYARQNNAFMAGQRRLYAQMQEAQQTQALQEQEFNRTRSENLKQGREKLLEAAPEWKDQKKWEADRRSLLSFALTRGYSEEEIAEATDPRAILLLKDSLELATLKAKKPEQAPQRGPRPLAAGAAQQGQNQGLRKARITLKQTGRVEDAAAAILRAGLV
jgi:hypothetical protein